MDKSIGIFGASGYAREVADICMEVGYTRIVLIDLNPQVDVYFNFQVVAESEIGCLLSDEFDFVIAVGNTVKRKIIAEKYQDLAFTNLIHPSATFGSGQIDRLKSKTGNIVLAGARFTTNIAFGNFGTYNQNCTIGHDCLFSDFVNIAPGANISGNVHLKDGVDVGANAVILQGQSLQDKLVIGRFSVVGAGAVVNKSVDDKLVVAGVPARVIKRK